MTKQIWLLVSVCCLTLVACAAERQRIGPLPCNEGTCFIAVSVSDCRIIVDPEAKEIARGNRSPVLHWTLDAGSFMAYSFAPDGIVFADTGREQFRSPERSTFGKEFTLVDQNTAAGKFKYTVRIVKRFGGDACPPFDPWVINGG